MARVLGGLVKPVGDPTTAAAVAAWASPPPRKTKRAMAGISDSLLTKLFAEITAMMQEGRVQDAEGKHFVALYVDLHCRVYGVPPAELNSKQRAIAATHARRMLEKDFGGDARKMAEYVSWVWTREKEREQWRRENQRDGSRIAWTWMFGPRMLTDYRLATARKKAG